MIKISSFDSSVQFQQQNIDYLTKINQLKSLKFPLDKIYENIAKSFEKLPCTELEKSLLGTLKIITDRIKYLYKKLNVATNSLRRDDITGSFRTAVKTEISTLQKGIEQTRTQARRMYNTFDSIDEHCRNFPRYIDLKNTLSSLGENFMGDKALLVLINTYSVGRDIRDLFTKEALNLLQGIFTPLVPLSPGKRPVFKELH